MAHLSCVNFPEQGNSVSLYVVFGSTVGTDPFGCRWTKIPPTFVRAGRNEDRDKDKDQYSHSKFTRRDPPAYCATGGQAASSTLLDLSGLRKDINLLLRQPKALPDR